MCSSLTLRKSKRALDLLFFSSCWSPYSFIGRFLGRVFHLSQFLSFFFFCFFLDFIYESEHAHVSGGGAEEETDALSREPDTGSSSQP